MHATSVMAPHGTGSGCLEAGCTVLMRVNYPRTQSARLILHTWGMQLQDILYSQGFGTRRVCAGLVQQGQVQVYMTEDANAPVLVTDSAMELEATGLRFRVQGVVWPFQDKAYLMLNKPPATECSQKPSTYPSIYTLLPAPLRQRPRKGAVQGVQAVGRLDQDTSGLLLLTDDGKFIH